MCVCVSWGQGHGQADAGTGPQAFPDEQRSCPCPFSVISWFFSNSTFLILFVRTMAAAALRRSAKSTPSRSSNQSWATNSGQIAEEELRNPALHEQQSSASILTLPKQQDQKTCIQGASTTSAGPTTGWIGTEADYWKRPHSTPQREFSVQYRPAGNDLAPLAGANSNFGAIAEAQLTHLISRDDAAQGQDALSDQDAAMPEVPTIHDIATLRRTIGERCRKWCIQSGEHASDARDGFE